MNENFMKEAKEVIDFLVSDKDFKEVYDRCSAANEGISYKDTLEYFLENTCYIQHYFIDRKYLDIAWLELSTKDVVDLDSLYLDYVSYIEGEYELFHVEHKN